MTPQQAATARDRPAKSKYHPRRYLVEVSVRYIGFLSICLWALSFGALAHAEGEPQVIGKGDPLLRELVATHVSKSNQGKGLQALRDRLLAAPRADWIPTLRAILERPQVGHAPNETAQQRDLVIDRMRDEDYWRSNAAQLLARLHDEPSLDLIFAERDGSYTLMPFGPPAVERAGRLLLDVHDPLREHLRYRNQPASELEIIQHVGHLLVSSGSPVVRDMLLGYANQTKEPCALAGLLAQLPKAPASVSYVRRAFLDGLAQSKPCELSVVGWADVALLRWMREQSMSNRVTGKALVDIDRALAELGDADVIKELTPEVSSNGTPADTEELGVYQSFVQQCAEDVACYVNALKGYKSPKPGSSRIEWLRMNKARAMTVRAQDAAHAEALLGNKQLYMNTYFSPFCLALEALVSPAFGKSVEKLPYLGDDLRLRAQMQGFVNPWQALLAPGVKRVSDASTPASN